MTARAFAPGFRLSVVDAVLLGIGVGAAVFAPRPISLVAATAIGHFFLFCNVFRMSRKPELIWAAVFVVLAGTTMKQGYPGWGVTIGAVVTLAVILIALETRKPSYHGIGWQKLNPDLPRWWAARNSGKRPSERP